MFDRTAAAVLLAVAVAGARAVDPAGTAEYTVTDKGRPVAGARACVTPASFRPGEGFVAGESRYVESDARGVLRLPPATGTFGLIRVCVRGPGGRGGFGVVSAGRKYPPTIELADNTDLPGRITAPAGNPIRGLKLTPVGLGPDDLTRYGGRPVKLADTPDWFWEAFPVKSSPDGTFAVTGVPAGHSVIVRWAAPGFGTGTFWLVPGQPAEMKFSRAGAVSIRFTAPAGAAAGNVRVMLTRRQGAYPVPVEVTTTGTTRAADGVTLRDLPPGVYDVSFPYTGPADYYPKPPPPVAVTAGETAAISVALEPAARIQATLIDSKTGRGVAGAELTASISDGTGQSIYVSGLTAGADGRIDARVPAGMVSVTPTPSDGYAVGRLSNDPFGQGSSSPVAVAPGQVRDLGRFTLIPTVDLVGTVVDPAGKPVAGAAVSVGYSGTNVYQKGPVVSDAAGRFTVKGLNPDGGSVGLTARKDGRLTAAPVVVDPGKPGADLRVVIAAENASRLKVRAVDRSGTPLPGVTVELNHTVTYLRAGMGVAAVGTVGKAGVTGPDGRWESDPLQAGDKYSISLSLAGTKGSAGPQVVAEPGKTHDFGDLRLTRGDFAVTGTVTDPGGNPVPGAKVFSTADGPKPVTTRADAAGRFTLGGLFAGRAYVSVTADGFRLTTVPADPGGRPVVVVLRRPTDPPAPPPTLSAAHKAAAARLTRHLLERLWAERVAAGDDGSVAVEAMALVDPPTARKWAAEEAARPGGRTDLARLLDRAGGGRPLAEVARDDPDEAVALLKGATGAEGFRDVVRLGRDLLPATPAAALRVAEDAAARARGLEQKDRPWALAEAGELVWLAGRPAAGKTLIEEAVALVEPLGFGGMDDYHRGTVAARVALYDAVKARRLIDPIKEARSFNRYLAQACVRLAGHDLPTATLWLADIRPDNSLARETARQLMAYRLATTRPDDAVAVAEGIENKPVRVVTLAGVASRLPAKERGRAVRLIDAAIDGILTDGTGYFSNNGGAGGTAAMVLYRAGQAGHPDLAAVRDKVLAARPPADDRPFAGSYSAGVRTALVLALTDPPAARALLDRDLTPDLIARLDDRNDREAIVALALADPTAAIPVVDALVAKVVRAKNGFRNTGLDVLVGVLTAPGGPERGFRRLNLVWDFEEE